MSLLERHLKWVCYNDIRIRQWVCFNDMNWTSFETRCRHESKDNDWSLDWVSQWTEQALLCSRHESEMSLLQWHLARRNRLETSDEMSLKHSMSRRNRLETSDEMSLKHSNRTIMKWTRKKELIEAMRSLLDWEKRVMLRACSVFYWDARSRSKSSALLSSVHIVFASW